jgi:hypothetical protein
MSDSYDVAAAKRLLDVARDTGFAFERLAEGPDACRRQPNTDHRVATEN